MQTSIVRVLGDTYDACWNLDKLVYRWEHQAQLSSCPRRVVQCLLIISSYYCATVHLGNNAGCYRHWSFERDREGHRTQTRRGWHGYCGLFLAFLSGIHSDLADQ